MTIITSGNPRRKRPLRDLSSLGRSRQVEESILRLREVVKTFGGSKIVAERCGVPLSTFSGYLAGREMKLSVAARVAETCGVTMEWLARGGDAGSASPDMSYAPMGAMPVRTARRSSTRSMVQFTRYEMCLSSGQGVFAPVTGAEGVIAVPDIMLPQRAREKPEQMIGLSVMGDSMAPTLAEGDVILVDTAVQSVLSGAIYAIRNDDEILVKRLQRHINGDMEVISDNPRYRSQIMEADTARRLWGERDAPLRIIGRVIWRGGSGPV